MSVSVDLLGATYNPDTGILTIPKSELQDVGLNNDNIKSIVVAIILRIRKNFEGRLNDLSLDYNLNYGCLFINAYRGVRYIRDNKSVYQYNIELFTERDDFDIEILEDIKDFVLNFENSPISEVDTSGS